VNERYEHATTESRAHGWWQVRPPEVGSGHEWHRRGGRAVLVVLLFDALTGLVLLGVFISVLVMLITAGCLLLLVSVTAVVVRRGARRVDLVLEQELGSRSFRR
jgi:hypothetical protein